MKALIFTLIILAVIATFFILAFLIPRRSSISSNSTIPTEYNGCVTGRVYDPTKNSCVIPNGGMCQNFADCSTDSYCNDGTCTSRDVPQGGLNQNCPCNDGLLCVSGLCKYPPTSVCTASDQCSTGFCVSGRLEECQPGEFCNCAVKVPNGGSCNSNVNCFNGNCSSGICQAPVYKTGDIGSYCNDTVKCRDSSCYQGICTAGNKKYYETCNVCSSTFLPLTDPNGGCQCVTSNNCSKNSCISGYTCRNSVCYGERYTVTNNASQCVSNSCSKPAGITALYYPIVGSDMVWHTQTYDVSSRIVSMIYTNNQLYYLSGEYLYVENLLLNDKTNSFAINGEVVYRQEVNGTYYQDNIRMGSGSLNSGMTVSSTMLSSVPTLLIHLGNNIITSDRTILYSDAAKICNNGYILTNSSYRDFASGRIFSEISNKAILDADLYYNVIDDGWYGIVLAGDIAETELYVIEGSLIYPIRSYYFSLDSRVVHIPQVSYLLSNNCTCG